MTIPLVTVWADKYKAELETAFAGAQKATKDKMWDLSKAMWGNWVDKSVLGLQCTAPITPPSSMTPTLPGAASFAPAFKGKSSVPLIAAELATQFETYASGITWTPPSPEYPFSAISSVVTQAASVSAAKAVLLAGLTAELAVMADPDKPDAKYKALGNLFRTAFASLMVEFIGTSTTSPPVTLIIPVPVI
jgi:hypothetical protein